MMYKVLKPFLILSLTLICISNQSIFSQFSSKTILSNTLAEPCVTVCFDVDNDGLPDLVTAANGVLAGSYTPSKIVWQKNLGNAKLGVEHFIVQAVDDWLAMVPLDIEGDGDMDLVASRSDAKLIIYKNLGNGSFIQNETINASANGIMSISCNDLDGDGDTDVITASQVNDRISWYANSAGAFGAEQVITNLTDFATGVFSADLDGDSDIDVASVSEGDGKVAWYQNDGSGIFGTQQIIYDSGIFPLNISGGDLDGDSDIDISVAIGNLDKIVWFENLGGGLFNSLVEITTLTDYPRWHELHDIDLDGDLDMISASGYDDKIAWHENLGSGNFGSQHIISINTDGANFVTCADFDVDGDMDVFAISSGMEDVILFYNNSMVFDETWPFLIDFYNLQMIIGSDVDSDGDKDLICSDTYYSRIMWFENISDGIFTTARVLTDDLNMPYLYSSGDIDLDGDEDYAVVSQNPFPLVWLENNYDLGIIDTHIILPTMVGSSSIGAMELLDINQDGILDILLTNQSLDELSWHQGLGAGQFGAKIVISSTIIDPSYFSIGDINGDTLVDILCSSEGDQLVVFQNTGASNFDTGTAINGNLNDPRECYLNDLDLDGDLDVVTVHVSGSKVIWFENDGLGNFGVEQTIVNGSLYSIRVCDLDMDGDTDILFNTLPTINWSENLLSGNFSVSQPIPSCEANADNYILVDLNNDGDKDIAMMSATHEYAFTENQVYDQIQVKGRVFFDINQNFINDSSDIGILGVPVLSTPASDFSFTSQVNGKYFHNFSDTSGLYLINAPDLEFWSLVTDSISYTVLIDTTYLLMDSLDFGFFPDSIADNVKIDFSGGFPRCNNLVNYWIDIKNFGTTTPFGIAELQLDNLLSYSSSSITPDSIIGQNIYWHFDSIGYFENIQFQVIVEMPDFTQAGNDIFSLMNLELYDTLNNLSSIETDSLGQTILCAYDPNDKGASPAGFGELGYIKPDVNYLEYLIRFQNTGNDTALNVIVTDQLSDKLDLNSFVFISSSHMVDIQMDNNGLATFLFNDIHLPDSNTNFLGSMGYIKFGINIESGAPIGTQILNQASIFFDSNPPVITNQTKNTIDLCFDSPIAEMTLFDFDTVCAQGLSQALPLSIPPGGIYFGTGVFEDSFDPNLAGVGEHMIYYQYTNNDGCTSLDSTKIWVENCLSLTESDQYYCYVYPNPSIESITVISSNFIESIDIYNMLGSKLIFSTQNKIDLSSLSSGNYIITVNFFDGYRYTGKISKL